MSLETGNYFSAPIYATRQTFDTLLPFHTRACMLIERAAKCYAAKLNHRRTRTNIHWSYRYKIIYGGGKWDKKEICKREGRRHRREKEGTENRRWRCGERRKRRDDVDKGAYATLRGKERDSGSESVEGLKDASTEENPKDDHGGTMKRAASARRRGMQLLFIPRRNRSDS